MEEITTTTDALPLAARVLRRLMPESPRNISKEDPMTNTITPTEFVLAPATTPEETLIDVVADVGNAESFVLVRQGSAVEAVAMPAARTLGAVFSAELFEQRGLGPASWAKLGPDEHVIKISGVERYLGRLAVQSGAAIGTGRGSDHRYSDGTILEFILASVAAALPGQAEIVARLTTLLPISLWSKHAEVVRAALQKSHAFEYKGRPVRIRFAEVVVKREGEVGYYGLPTPPMGRTLILDGGGRTFNIALFMDGVFVRGDTIDNLGVEFVLDTLDKQLRYSGARPMLPAERKDLLTAIRTSEPYSIVVDGQQRRIDIAAKTLFVAAAVALAQELHARVKIDQVEHATFIGGAAYSNFFGATLAQQIPRFELATDPATRNAYGALAQLGGPVVKKAKRTK